MAGDRLAVVQVLPNFPLEITFLFISSTSFQPVANWLNSGRLAVIKEPGIHCEMLSVTSVDDHGSPMKVENQWMTESTVPDLMPFEQPIVKHEHEICRCVFGFRNAIQLAGFPGASNIASHVTPGSRNGSDNRFQKSDRLANSLTLFSR